MEREKGRWGEREVGAPVLTFSAVFLVCLSQKALQQAVGGDSGGSHGHAYTNRERLYGRGSTAAQVLTGTHLSCGFWERSPDFLMVAGGPGSGARGYGSSFPGEQMTAR